MQPLPPVTYLPETLDEVAALVLAADGQPRPTADGTTLIVHEAGEPAPIVIDLSRVPELNRLDYDERDGLLVGAGVPLDAILEFPPLHTPYAMLADAIRDARPVEPLATLGAVLGNAAPVPDFLAPLICLGASVAIFGPHGWSEMGVEGFARPNHPALHDREFLVDMRLPSPGPRAGGAVVRAAERGAGVAVLVLLREDLLTCCGARMAAWFEGGLPVRALDAERLLQGRVLDESLIRQGAELIVSPATSHRAALQVLALDAIGRARRRACVS